MRWVAIFWKPPMTERLWRAHISDRCRLADHSLGTAGQKKNPMMDSNLKLTDRRSSYITIRIFIMQLTSHRAEAKLLVSIIVRGGSTPLHVVSPSLRSTISVVAVVIQEGEVAQSTI